MKELLDLSAATLQIGSLSGRINDNCDAVDGLLVAAINNAVRLGDIDDVDSLLWMGLEEWREHAQKAHVLRVERLLVRLRALARDTEQLYDGLMAQITLIKSANDGAPLDRSTPFIPPDRYLERLDDVQRLYAVQRARHQAALAKLVSYESLKEVLEHWRQATVPKDGFTKWFQTVASVHEMLTSSRTRGLWTCG